MIQRIAPATGIPGEMPHKTFRRIPAGRPGKPQETGTAVTSHCRDDCGCVTGSDFSINGGLHPF